MENATKALIMAGTILIALLIISLGVYLFNTYSDFAYEKQEQQAKQEKIQFNTKFEKYVEKDLSLQDVITIVNLAKEYNEKYEEAGSKIEILVAGIDWTALTNKKLIQKLEDSIENNENKKYIIENYNSIEYDSDGIVKKLYIKMLQNNK